MELLSRLAFKADTKTIMLVRDGLGGLLDPNTGLTELETAATLNLDSLTCDSMCGLAEAVGPGITPWSGPGHLALFGYDAVRYEIGRDVMAAIGTGMTLGPDDTAARVNFCIKGK